MRRIKGGGSHGRTVRLSLLSPSPFGLRRQTSSFSTSLSSASLNAVTSWPTILNVRVRRQIDAETKSSFPATLADIESMRSIAITKSCTLNFARRRCDRQHPCGACSRRGLTNHCNYSTTSSSTPDAQRCVAPRQSTSLHGRISELETLVVTLMKGQSVPSPPAPKSPKGGSLSVAGVSPDVRRPKKSQDEASPADPGTLKLHKSGTSYVQSGHWEAILTKIRGLKEDLVTDTKAPPGSHLFYGPNRHATRDEILVDVPPRPVVDRLMALHFDSYIITPCQCTQAFFPLSEALTVCCRYHS